MEDFLSRTVCSSTCGGNGFLRLVGAGPGLGCVQGGTVLDLISESFERLAFVGLVLGLQLGLIH